MTAKPRVIIIGAGPAGLFAAEILAEAGVSVSVFDAKRTPGLKFLRAGIGGLNITHSEPFDVFRSRYREKQAVIGPMLSDFPPEKLLSWLRKHGSESRVGSSGRVFPTEMKSSGLLRRWLRYLEEAGVSFHGESRWAGFEDSPLAVRFLFNGEIRRETGDAVLLALGGGSWPKLGSDGQWVGILRANGVPVKDLESSNCGFDVSWTEKFREEFSGKPLKNISAENSGNLATGECVITRHGLEGGIIYALSADLRREIHRTGEAVLKINLLPGRSEGDLIAQLKGKKPGQSLTNRLRHLPGMTVMKIQLLYEATGGPAGLNSGATETLAATITSLPLRLKAPRPLAEAISSAGGVDFAGLDESLMLRKLPGVFCAGEMLDWEAPTGGYLLTAVFATSFRAAEGILQYLKSPKKT